MKVASLDMAVWQNIQIPNMKVILSGIGCIVLSIVGFVFAFRESA